MEERMPATIDAVRVLILFIIPGFICQRTISTTLSRRAKDASLIIIEAITFSCVEYAIVGWIFFFVPLPSLGILQQHQTVWQNIGTALLWVAFFFLVPVLLGVGWAKFLHGKWLPKLHEKLNLPSVNPYARAWDFYFSKRKPAWVIIRLLDDSFVGGFMEEDSLVSSYPDPEDIYLEKAYTVSKDGTISADPISKTGGVWVNGSQIKCIEFIAVDEKDITYGRATGQTAEAANNAGSGLGGAEGVPTSG
jgi:hypothetical protein